MSAHKLPILQTPEEAAQWLRERVTGGLHCDSRAVAAGDGFIAWPGSASDGRRYVSQALAQGAAAALVQAEGVETYLPAWQALNEQNENIACYSGLKQATAAIAAAYYGHPSAELSLVAVTGTNGKTSTTWWLAQALSQLPAAQRLPCAIIGTLGVGPVQALQLTGMTTPDPVFLQSSLRAFVQQGLKACAIEASSIGIAEHRLDASLIKVAVFTNFTQDHLDYHGSMDAYWQEKRKLFSWPGLQAAVLNIDDVHGYALAQTLLQEGRLAVWTYSCQGKMIDRVSALCARDIVYTDQGLHYTVTEGAQQQEMQTHMVGHFNVSNMLAVLAVLRSLGASLTQAIAACAGVRAVPGRMETVQPGDGQTDNKATPTKETPIKANITSAAPPNKTPQPQQTLPWVMVDYAHTPDALEQALVGLRPLALQRGGALWCVFGCGGNRDASKRPLMGKAAQNAADRVVLTSDNPRFENAAVILQQIAAGMDKAKPQRSGVVATEPSKTTIIESRAEAIRYAISHAAAQDVVLIAGKGHEDYQEIADVKHPFDDRTCARLILEGLNATTALKTSKEAEMEQKNG